MVDSISSSTSESARTTIAVALVATFLAIVFNMDKLIPDSPSSLIIIVRGAMYANFLCIVACFVLYLLFLGRSLKYIKKRSDVRASDLSVCLQFLLLIVLKKEKLPAKKEDRVKWFDEHAIYLHTFFYDEAISLSFFFPISIAYTFVGIFLPSFLMNIWHWASWVALLATIGIILVLVLSGVFLNIGRFLITGEQ